MQTPENKLNSQEVNGANQAPKPFNPKDTARIEELNAKFENPENIVGRPVSGPDTTDQFEGSKIFTFDKGGIPMRYAIRRNAQGELEGNSFRLQEKVRSASGESWRDSSSSMHTVDSNHPSREDYRIPTTYRMSEAELHAVEKLLEGKI